MLGSSNKPSGQQDTKKKGSPWGFLLLLIAAILIVVTVQNFTQTKVADIAFNYQLEHLVNLDLIQPGESKKTALNDNLVSFSGKFRDNVTEGSKKRFRYLELLNGHSTLRSEKKLLVQELKTTRAEVVQAADWYLSLSGVPTPKGGYRVVDLLYDMPEQDNHIVIQDVSKENFSSLQQLQEGYKALQADSDTLAVKEYGEQMLAVVRGFRSPVLGIGIEEYKRSLRTLDTQLAASIDSQETVPQRLAQYSMALAAMEEISHALNQSKNSMRLTQLRSVREYKRELDRYQKVTEELEQNQAQLDKARQSVADVYWFINNKEVSTSELEQLDGERYAQWFTNAKQEWENFAKNRSGTFKAPDQPRNLVLEKTFRSEEPSPNWMGYLFTILPVALIVLLLYFVFSRQMRGAGSGAMNFGKSPAKMLTKEKNSVTFDDVAGIDEAKEELYEIVEFLKNPSKFTALGGKIPKGVLCIGAPGTGKTLIAKAVAGEADRPFFSISGSDFVEMFVGVGASRIRDMFEQAKKQAPCIIFIDEIDAVGRHRGAGIGGGHDEREQTLNQLLVEMDGFDSREGVILMAATNRPDVLDKALLRPGRFDRRVVIDLPDLKGRFEILKVHARNIKIDKSVNLMAIARATPGASGADLANLLNEAALLAAKRGRTAVTGQETIEASDKVRFGKERRSLEIDEDEKRTTAIHESGHAVVGLVVEHSDPVDKVTIIPRGFSLGATHFLPEKNKLSYWKREMVDRIAVLMGGRCAEEVFLGDASSGAQQDIKEATRLARSMVCEWGMSEELGLIAYDEHGDSNSYMGWAGGSTKKYSEATAFSIDNAVKKIADEGYLRAKEVITTHRKELQLMADMLMEFETLDAEDVKQIIKGEWDIEGKRNKIAAAAKLHCAPNPTPPPLPEEGKETKETDDTKKDATGQSKQLGLNPD
ncbi:ATP-dependent zinc metalloprotease FtsH [Simkania negevensis]|uniref:ATP-dependent zinc metalloprotease FtsH n=1 Tax=Simkania negevensis TaxID=83561 RepID=A0ABS3AU10_9BACT|nr:ATP-dependent zinc metalloprotease FtsH [Simkania negevensis]